MNKTLKVILIVIGALVVIGGLAVAAGFAFMNWRASSQYGFQGVPPMMRGYGYGPGPMMGGRGYGPDGFGPMMGGRGGYGQNVQPLTVDEAKQAAQKYVDGLGINNLALGDVMIFSNNAYVAVKEADTGIGAFELLVDPVNKVAYPEPGANIMWNLKYGAVNQSRMMAGHGMGWMTLAPGASAGVGGYGQNGVVLPTPANVTLDMPISADQAVKDAQAYLDSHNTGATASSTPAQFYGYYTLDFSKDGKTVGMLSINGYNGEIFLHTWHGTFIQEGQ